MLTILSRAIAVGILSIVVFAGTGNAHAATLPKDANTTCPVMKNEEVDPDIFVNHDGKRIYLCCTKCKRRFSQNPEKYLKYLPASDDAKSTLTKRSAPVAKK